MRSSDLSALWRDAEQFDPTLALPAACIPKLLGKLVRPERYSRRRLFCCMMNEQPVVFRDFELNITGDTTQRRAKLLPLIAEAFSAKDRARVQVGPSRLRRTLPVADVLRRWQRPRGLISVTDLHIRGTPLEHNLGIDRLSDFNVFVGAPDSVARQEIMTMVIGSRGNVTDSHSDDPDGSNHCFVGKKLWLAWETFEGRAKGLEDLERDYVTEQAHFDMATFLSLSSARWFVVSAGDTLFLPGKLTHKVITLEHYLGVGSFYVALPNCIQTILRWHKHGPLWALEGAHEKRGLIDDITSEVTKRVLHLKRDQKERERWGYSFLLKTASKLARDKRQFCASLLRGNAALASLLTIAKSAEINLTRRKHVL